MAREKAAELLADVWFTRGVKEGIAYFGERLSSTEAQEPMWGRLREWQQSLSGEEADLVRFALEQAVRGAVLGLAIYFDGATGYEEVEDKPGEFTIVFRTYPSVEAARTAPPTSTVLVCPAEYGEDVHDIFLARFDEEDARR